MAIFLEPRNAKFRLHVMPLAVGMYLPFSVTTPLLLGGIVYWLVERNDAAAQVDPQLVANRTRVHNEKRPAGIAAAGRFD